MKITIGLSTCPNDTFIFDAILHKKIDTQGFEFEYITADVEELNQLALKGEIDITKISFHVYAYIANNYKILDSGSALGRNNGPLLISKKFFNPEQIPFLKKIAIPGQYTTANLLLHIAFNKLPKLKEYLFSDIVQAILNNEVDAGLIIHETRFVYQQKGLVKIIDLGEFWEQNTGLPVPLGGIIINRKFDLNIQTSVQKLLRKSIEYALNNPHEPYKFIKKFAQEMDENVMYNHIKLYVNDFTLSLGKEGRDAIIKLFEKGYEIGMLPKVEKDIFIK